MSMRTIIVEDAPATAGHDGCDAHAHLDALAAAVAALGHRVIRWSARGELPDVGATDVLWWGNEVPAAARERAALLHVRPLYAELGWLSDRRRALQLDRRGANGLADWCGPPGPVDAAGPPLEVGDGPVLVCLRYEGAAQRTTAQVSPWFGRNLDWVQHLRAATDLPLRLRPHPQTWPRYTNQIAAVMGAQVEWSGRGALEDELAAVRAVAVIDSTAGAQALECGLPVLCFGRQVFRWPGAVYCLDNDRAWTAAACAELAAGRCTLRAGTVAALVAEMRRRQWPLAEAEHWPQRLRTEFGL